MQYQIICMSFDGEYKKEKPIFQETAKAWEYSGELGSKWYFYPFHFIISKNTIRDTPLFLSHLRGKRINTVQRIFKKLSQKKSMEGATIDDFIIELNREG